MSYVEGKCHWTVILWMPMFLCSSGYEHYVNYSHWEVGENIHTLKSEKGKYSERVY